MLISSQASAAEVQADDSERQVRRADGGDQADAGAATDQRTELLLVAVSGPEPVQLRRQVGLRHGAAQGLWRAPDKVQ